MKLATRSQMPARQLMPPASHLIPLTCLLALVWTAPVQAGPVIVGPAGSEPAKTEPQYAERAAKVDYRADKQCPTQAEFAGLVAAQQGLPLDSPRSPFVELSFRLEAKRGGARGSFRALDAAGREQRREVSAPSCQAAAEALALVWSLITQQEEVPVDAAASQEDAPSGPETPEAESVAAPARWGLHLGPGVNWGLLPQLSPELALGLSYGRLGSGLWSPLLRLQLQAGLPVEKLSSDQGGRFQALGAKLRFCPGRLRALGAELGNPGFGWSLALCPEAALRMVRAEGLGVSETSQVSTWLPLLGLGLDSELHFGANWSLGVEFTPQLALLRPQFLLNGETLYQLPLLSLESLLALRYYL